MAIDVVETLCDLVRIPSVNPMGRDVSGPEYFEHAVTEHLEQQFTRWGWPWERQQVEPLRANILTRIDGDPTPEQGGRLVLFEAHQDTVPVEGMTIPPWTPNVDKGRVYGRGACDIKGGMASMIAACARLAKERPAGRATVVLACTVNEEHGFSGAARVAESWASGESKLLPRRPDAVVVAEPTMLDVVVAHKGVVRWKLRTRGRAAHSSRPQLGENAIYRMARVVLALEEYASSVVGDKGRHRLLGSPTLSVGLIHGGISVNTVPDECAIEIDRRILPGEDPHAAREDVIAFVAAKTGLGDRVVHESPFIVAYGLADKNNGALADSLAKAARAGGQAGNCIGVPYGTDAAVFARASAPSVVLGPGSIDQAHTADEWVEVDQLRQAADIYYRFVAAGG